MAAVVHDITTLIEGQKRGRLPLQIMICSCALMVIEGYDMQVAGYAAPAMIADLHVTKAMFTPVFSLGMFGYMIGAIVLGMLSDYVGRKRVILLGTCWFGVLTLATAFTRDIALITMLRFLAGVGLGAGIPATMALAAEYSPVGVRGRRTTLMYVGYTLGGAVSGVVASQLLVWMGWPSLFVVGGLLPLAIAASIGLVVPESACFLALRPGRRAELIRVLRRLRPDLSFDDDDRFTLAETPAAGVPMSQLFTEGRVAGTILLWCCFILNFVALHFITSWLPTVLNSSGLSVSASAVISSTFLVGGSIGGLLAGRFLDKGGLRPVAGMILVAVPFVAAIGIAGGNVALLAACVCLSGVTMMGGQIGLNATPGLIYPTSVRSTGVGWALGIGRIGSVIGPALGGILLTYQLSTPLIFAAASVPVLMCSACLLLLARVQARAGRGAQPAAGAMATSSRTVYAVASSGSRFGSLKRQPR